MGTPQDSCKCKKVSGTKTAEQKWQNKNGGTKIIHYSESPKQKLVGTVQVQKGQRNKNWWVEQKKGQWNKNWWVEQKQRNKNWWAEQKKGQQNKNWWAEQKRQNNGDSVELPKWLKSGGGTKKSSKSIFFWLVEGSLSIGCNLGSECLEC